MVDRHHHAQHRVAARRWAACVVAGHIACLAAGASGQARNDLADLSLEELSQIQVTTVSRRPENLGQSAAAVYVITADEIRRSGAATLPEALRLAPNLEVARTSSQQYVISARGFNSVNASNKMLVLIDGRSVFTPFFNSAFWDQQSVVLADVERIEVVSGPGGTLWGANAVNGVINVITRSSAATQGGIADVQAGDFLQQGTLRYGTRVGDGGFVRAYVQGFGQGHTFVSGGGDARDDWQGAQTGFRADWDTAAGAFVLQGDAYHNRVDTPSGMRSGGNLLGRWSTQLSGQSRVEVQAYYDQQDRRDNGAPPAPGYTIERVRTFDVQAQQTLALGAHQADWGLGHREWYDRFVNTRNPFVLDPESQSVSLSNVFAQDTYAVRKDLKLTAGLKLEYSSFSGWAVMPSLRAGWQATSRDFIWAAVSRAVRPPSRVERDLAFTGFFGPSPQFTTEKLVAYEAGWRAQLAPRATAAISVFYNHYSDLRTTALVPTSLPGQFGNGLQGHTDGVEAWANFSVLPWWRIDPGVTLLHKDFHLKPGAVDISGIQTVVGHDPAHQWFVRSYMDLPGNTQLYVGVRRIGALGDVGVPGYVEADMRLGWQVRPDLEVSLAGQNLLHARHAEAREPPTREIPRQGYLGLRWTFR